jgi:AcrR family transcriptional regulator
VGAREGEEIGGDSALAANERREAKKAQSRSRILEAARGIFFRDGFMEANLDDVAMDAGVAKGTLYRYFENKAELYVAVLASNGEQFERKLRDAGRDETISAPDRIRRIARFYLAHWTQNREYFQIFWALENQAVIGELPEGVLEEVTRLWQSCLQILTEIVQAGIDEGSLEPCDAWEVAHLLWTLANGLIQSEASPPHRQIRRRPLAESFVRAIDLVLAGLTSPGLRAR